jgi:hypothetical protein
MLRFERLEQRELLAVFHVATGGNDANAGTADAPWRTLQKAANSVSAGDEVIVETGNYRGFNLARSGTAAAPIIFSAQPGVVINQPNSRTPDGVNLEGANYVVIEGFTVNGMPRAGIRSAVNQHATIRNNRCDQNGVWGIFSGFSDDLVIENNETSRSIDEHGIYVSNSGDRPVIRGNLVWGNHANGIHMNGDLSQGGDGLISGALVERNVVYDNGVGGGSGINADGVIDSVFQNNLLYDNHASGISLYQIDGAAGSTNNRVVNNTIVQASNGRWALNIQDASTGNQVFNNIFYNHHSFRGSIDIDPAALPGFISDYNVVMNRFTINGGDSRLTLAGWRAATGQDSHSIIATPSQLFVDSGADDYHLKPGSPAVDGGTNSFAPLVDFETQPRPAGATWDIGADELSMADVTAPTVTAVSLRGSTWNPAMPPLVLSLADATAPVLPWSGVDQVSVVFSEAVDVSAGDLTVERAAGGNLAIESFVYDATTRTAQWRLTSPLAIDRVTLALDAALADLAGNVLVGRRDFELAILPGDADADGLVSLADFQANRSRQFSALGQTGYIARHDFDGSGAITIADWAAVRDRIGQFLPAAAASSPAIGSFGVTLRASRSRRATPASG